MILPQQSPMGPFFLASCFSRVITGKYVLPLPLDQNGRIDCHFKNTYTVLPQEVLRTKHDSGPFTTSTGFSSGVTGVTLALKDIYMASGKLQVKTSSHMELIDITNSVTQAIQGEEVQTGVLFLFNPHTTAGLTINEGADPAVRKDIINGLKHIVPQTLNYKHMEGNSPSHIMTLLTGSSLTIEIEKGKLVLGTWQRIFFCEYDGPRNRTVNWKLLPA